MSFVVTGGLALLFAVWWFLAYKEPDEHPKVSESELAYIRQDEIVKDGKVVSDPVPMRKLVTYPTIVKAALGYAAYLYVWNVFTYWLPAYLMLAKGLSLKEMGFAAMIPYIFAVIFELIGGVVFDRWYRSGASHTLLRRTGMGIAMVGAAVFIFLCVQADTSIMLVFWLTCYCTISGFGASNVQAIPSDLAPYGQAGGVAGFIGFVGNIGALLAPMVTGFIVDTPYGYNGAFIVAAVVCLVSAAFYVFNSYDRVKPKTAVA
jgi:ACS family glucarate transporter-like MFS transporter